MKRLILTRSLYLAPLLATVTFLSGCADSFRLPDTIVNEPGGSFGPIKGTVYGGHAPIVGAHVYVLQPGSGATGAQASDVLGVPGTTAPAAFPFHTNTSDPNIPVGWKYIITDATGSFDLTNAIACSANQPVYMYAYGGNASSSPTPINPSIVNLATLGLCPGYGNFSGAITYVYMNEVSTVATAYAFQGFTSAANNDATHIGYSGTVSGSEGLKGIQNAANNTFQLYDIQGSVAGHNANTKTYNLTFGTSNAGLGFVPQLTLDTLADILAACVDSSNTASPPAGGSNCASLFAIATADGTTTGTLPTDTATAAINIARHPAGVGYSAGATYASALFALFTPTGAPFTPLSVAPPDFTVAIQYPSASSAVFALPMGIATDASGNFWFTSQQTAPNLYPTTGAPTYGTGYFVEGSPTGTVLTDALNTSYSMGNVAIDSAGNAWTGTLDGVEGPIYKAATNSGASYTSYNPGFTRPDAPVADNSTSDGYLYMVHGPTCPTPNFASPYACSGSQSNPTLNEVLNGVSGGTTCDLGPTSSTANCTNGLNDFISGAYVTHAAIDGAGYIWMTSDSTWVVSGTTYYGSAITRVSKGTGMVPTGSSFPINPAGSACGSGLFSPEQPAIDSSGNAWIPMYGKTGQTSAMIVVNPSGTCIKYPKTGKGPYGAAVDGVSNVWVTNRTDNTFMGLNNSTGLSLTSTATVTGPNLSPQNNGNNLLSDPSSIAVDISGDVFITNYVGSTVVEVIGLTTPVYGPLGVAAGTVTAGVPQIGVTP